MSTAPASWNQLCADDPDAAVWFGEQAEAKEAELVLWFRCQVLEVLHRTARMKAGYLRAQHQNGRLDATGG